ncbi:hypothetical protein KKI23_03415, partial [Patescibacteria group bacterium]|nr:hypothetical protein [Patescibacteria group bacterium]
MAKNIVSKKEPTKNRNDKEFSDFFKKHGQDVKKQDMSIIERAPLNIRRNRFLFIFIILILIAVAAWLGFYVFTQENNYTGDNIIVEMDIQDQVASGDEISVDILISNSEAVDLKVSELTVRFPEGFKFSSANPEASNEFNNAWDLGVIQAGTEKRVTVRGQLVGEVDSEKVFLATYSYTPSDFNYEFQEIGIELDEWFGQNCWWIFSKPEAEIFKIKQALEICKS